MTTTPKFSILHTSARPAKWREIYEAWLAAADHPEDVEYILVVDERWGFPSLSDKQGAASPVTSPMYRNMRAQDVVLVNTERKCYVDGVNIAALHASGDVLIVNADDQYPCPHWDTLITKTMEVGVGSHYKGLTLPGNFNPTRDEFVLAANTGTPTERERGIVVMPIMSRARYSRLGYVFYPQYESMYADNDLCEHAKHDKCLYGLNTEWVFPHRHPFFSTTPMDAAYEAQNRSEAYALGAEIFKRRQAAKFADIDHVEVAAVPPARKHLAVCLPGREWPLEFMSMWTDMVMRLVSTVPLNLTPIFGAGSDISVVRHMLAQRVLNDLAVPADFVLWIDSDNVLPFPYLLEMLRTLDTRPEISAVSAWCWLLYPAGRISCGSLDAKRLIVPLDHAAMMAAPDDLQEVEYTGFPAVLMRREVLEQAGANPFCPMVSDQFTYGKSGEDYAFCARARQNGARFFVDRRLKVDHLKLGALDGEAMAKAVAVAAEQIPVPVET